MNKKLIAFLSALSLLLSFSFIPANADSANPPVITGFTQVTQGPYKPGDMIQFKIEYTGGNPGLSDYWFLFGSRCITIKDGSPQYHWSKSNGGEENQFFGNGLFTGFVQACSPGQYQVDKIEIKDKTNLFARKQPPNFGNGAEKFTIADYEFKPLPAGIELSSPKLQDELNLIDIPKNPKVGSSYELPIFTKVGFPVQYRLADANFANCNISKNGFNDYTPFFGGLLTFTRPGNCRLYIGILDSGPSGRTKYAIPQLIANVSNQGGVVSYSVGANNSKKSINCIKGKKALVVSGTNPKCPSGYKIKA